MCIALGTGDSIPQMSGLPARSPEVVAVFRAPEAPASARSIGLASLGVHQATSRTYGRSRGPEHNPQFDTQKLPNKVAAAIRIAPLGSMFPSSNPHRPRFARPLPPLCGRRTNECAFGAHRLVSPLGRDAERSDAERAARSGGPRDPQPASPPSALRASPPKGRRSTSSRLARFRRLRGRRWSGICERCGRR